MAQRHLAQKLGRASLLQRGALTATRGAANELTGNWVRRLGATSTTPVAREAHSQLSSLLDFYNVPAVEGRRQNIDWDSHRAKIHTPGVVDKIKAKYDGFMASEYQVDSAVARCGGSTEKMQALDVAMKYNFALYMAHYMGHLDQLETMRNIGDLNEMSMLEVTKLMPGVEMLQASVQEIGNLAPDSYTEEAVMTRVCTQFSWGTRYTPPFTHSQDTINCVVSTLGKLGK